MIYTAPGVMLLMRAASITRESERGLGPENRESIGECPLWPKNVELHRWFYVQEPKGFLKGYLREVSRPIPSLQCG